MTEMNTASRRNWFLRNESLWTDLDTLKAKSIADGVYSPNLSNIDSVLEGQIQKCRAIKRFTASPSEPLKPKTDLILTVQNFDELIKQREVIDILTGVKHPVRLMDDSGFTYYDYALFKRKKHGKAPSHVISEINTVFSGGDIDLIY